MAYVKPKNLSFTPAENDGASSYCVWVLTTGTVVDYDTPYHDVGMQTSGIELGELTNYELDDGNYDIHVASKDDAGNMSDIVEIVSNYPLDLTAPLAPLSGSVS